MSKQAPIDTARDTFEAARNGDISPENAITVLQKHLMSTNGEGKRAAQIESWLEQLERMAD